MIDREFTRCFLKLYVLWRISRSETYGLEIIQELGQRGTPLSPGTLYPVLH